VIDETAAPPTTHTTHTTQPDAGANALKRDVLGVPSIFFYVIAAASPLTVVIALLPIMVGLGNGPGAAGTFVLATAALLVFAVGYVAMSRHITNTGAFYAYVTAGLGREAGLGSAFLTMFGYNAIQAALYGGLGFYVDGLLETHVGVDLPWWVWSLVAVACCTALGIQGVHSGARVLGFFMTLELVMIATLVVASLVHGDTPVGEYSLRPFAPDAVFSGGLGVSLLFAVCSFIGFEGSAIYGEEAKDPARTIPRAAYLSVTFMGVVYAVTTWAVVNAVGVGGAQQSAVDDSGNWIFVLSGRWISDDVATVYQVLIVTAMFAAIVTFHNNAARYLYALGREGLIWGRLGRTHATRQTPYVASFVQSGTIAAVVGGYALAGLDPVVDLFVGLGGIGTVAVIFSQVTVSVAIIAFFRRTGADRRVWNTLGAPVLATLALGTIFVMALRSLDLLLGVTGTTAWLMVSTVFVVPVLGTAYGWFLRTSRPERYAKLDTVLSVDSDG